MVEDARQRAAGLPIAYIDRVNFVGRKRMKAQEADLNLPIFKVPKRMGEFAANNDWHTIWKVLRKEPLLAASLFAHTLVGIGRDAVAVGANFVRKFDPELPLPGKIVTIAPIDKETSVAEILVPLRQGGSELIALRCRGSIFRDHEVGGAVDLYKRAGKQPYYRIRAPYVTAAFNGRRKRFDFLDAKEIASTVRAQYDDLDFCGHWERVREVNDFIKQDFPSFPSNKCGLYRHAKTGDGILIFRGTNFVDVADHVVNFATMRGLATPQYKHAPDITKMVQARFCNRMIVAGHSKGGGIAQYASACTGVRAVCFNSVGLPESFIEDSRKRSGKDSGEFGIDHFLVRYDWVSNVAGVYHSEGMSFTDPFTKKRQRFLADTKDVHFLDSPHSRMRVLALHNINTVVQCLEDDRHLLRKPFEELRQDGVPFDRMIRVKDMLPEDRLPGRSLTGRAIKKELSAQKSSLTV